MLLQPEDYLGLYVQNVTLETWHGDKCGTKLRVRPVDKFSNEFRVEFPRNLRVQFPVGTRFKATVKVCQNKTKEGVVIGKPYLRASDIAVMPESIPDKGIMARVRAGSISGLAYEYIPTN